MGHGESELIELVAGFARDPLGFVRGAWEWGKGDLAGSDGPRAWQTEMLDTIGQHLRKTPHEPLKISVASGHGIGKSALIGWIIAWALSTCDDCRVVVTAGSGAQLQTKTIPEVSKWFRSAINAHWWDVRANSIRSLSKGHGDTWRADYLTWSEDNPQAFAGLHNQGKRIVVVYDEASAIAAPIWDTTAGALTDQDTEIIFIAFGNPTQNTGRFRECFGSAAHRWITRQIDSRTVDGTNKAEISKWVEDYGEDSDFVRVKVRGEFPRSGSSQFVGSDLVAACRKYKAQGHERMPKIMAVDVARFGDDQTVLALRQGRKASFLATYRGLDNMQVAAHVVEFIGDHAPDAVVIDGDGLGAGVVDRVKQLGFGRKLTEFHGGHAAHDGSAYYNRRAEIWGAMRDALKAGMEIPDLPEIEADICGPQYGFSAKQQVQLEKKEDMKRRGLGSPDLGDALAMTFAVKVATPQRKSEGRPQTVGAGSYAGGWMG